MNPRERERALRDLDKAIRKNDLIKVQTLLASGLIDIDAQTHKHATPLVLAIRLGHKAIVEALLNAGPDVDKVDNFNRTACHVAAERGDGETMALLLALNPNLGLRDHASQTPLDIAYQYKFESVVLQLIEAGTPLSPQFACDHIAMSAAVAQAFVNRGVVLSELRTSLGETPLRKAVSADVHKPDLLDLLVNGCGIDVDALDSLGNTCCHTVVFRGYSKQLRWLIDAGADLEILNNRGRSALFEACAYDQTDCCLLLIAAGANVRVQSEAVHCLTPLHVATGRVIVHALLAAGADPDVENARGETARQRLTEEGVVFDANRVDAARRRIASMRLEMVRNRALQVCIGLQSQWLDALQTCEILQHACGRVAPLIPFHFWWTIATTVKHFRKQ